MERTPVEALQAAVDMVGSQSELAKRLGTTQARVWNWLNRDNKIAAEYVLDIERETGVSRYELRPDIFKSEQRA